MSRLTVRAFLAVACGVAVSLAAPAASLAHGRAHAELLEHASAHHMVPAGSDIATFDADAQHDGHGHPALDPGWSSRLIAPLPALCAPRVSWDFLALSHERSATPPAPFESPPPWFSAPAQPRAPPAL
jgi:hypothetical protein